MMRTSTPKPEYKIVNTLFDFYDEVPKEWEIRSLGDFSREINMRYAKNKPAPILSVTKHKGFVDSLEYFKKQVFSKDLSNYKMVEKNDFAYATIHLEEGSLGLLQHLDNGYVSPMYTVFRIDSTVNSQFLYRLMKTERYLQKYASLGEGTVNRRKSILFDNLKKLKVPLPPLFEQNKIVSILSKMDLMLDYNSKIIEKTQNLKKGMMTQLLTKGIRHTKFRKIKSTSDKHDEIPEGWEVVHLGNVCRVRKSEENIISNLYVGLEHIGQGTNSLIGKGDVKDFVSTKHIFKKGDVLYGKLRPLLNKVWLATQDGYCSTDILPLITNEKLDNLMLEKILSSDQFVNFAVSTSAGTKMPRTNWSDMQQYEIKLPPMIEQQKIAQILSNVNNLIEKQQEFKSIFEIMKKELSQKLLTGELRIKNDL